MPDPKKQMLKPLPKPVSMNESKQQHKSGNSSKPNKPNPPTRPVVKVQPKVIEPPRPNRKRRRFNVKRVIGLALSLAILVGLLGFVLLSRGGATARALYINEERFAYIGLSEEWDEDSIMREVQRRLHNIHHMQVVINEEIKLQPTSITDIEEQIVLPYYEAIEQLINVVTFRVIGSAIEVNGRRMAILRNQEEIEEVKWHIKRPFTPSDYVSVDFVERFETVIATVNLDQISTVSGALQLLDGQIIVMEEYIVRSGDSLSHIAAAHGISQERLLAANPGFTPATLLRIGDVMLIETSRPYLSVRTVEEITNTETISIEIQNRENPGRQAGTSEIIQYGREGERQIIKHITRINGVHQSAEDSIVSTVIINDMIPQIVEVGTMIASFRDDEY